MSDGNGELPEGWATTKIGEVAHVTSGFGFPKRLQGRTTGEVPFAKVGDVSRAVLAGSHEIDGAQNFISECELPELRAKRLPTGATVFAKIGEAIRLNRRALTTRPMVVDNNVMAIIPNSEALSNWFFFHYFRTVELGELANATTVPSVRKSDVLEIPLGLPPLPEQRRIVSKIESLQERSSRARQALSEVGPLLEQFRQSVLRAAFSGRLTADWRARNPDVEPATEFLSRIRTERRHRWEQSELAKYGSKGKKPPKNWQDRYKEPAAVDDSDLPELPDGWAWTRLGDVASFINGDRGKNYPNKSEYVPSGLPFINTGHIDPDGILSLERMNHITREKFDSLGSGKIQIGDLVYCLRGATLGKTAFVEPFTEGAIASSLVIIRPDDQRLRDYFYHFLVSPLGRDEIDKYDNGSAQPNLSANSVTKYLLPVPSAEEIKVICELLRASELRARDTAAGVAESESSLTQLDQSILAKAFRGELVPQDPRDEPASELLARIRTTRESEAAAKKKSPKKTTRKKKAKP